MSPNSRTPPAHAANAIEWALRDVLAPTCRRARMSRYPPRVEFLALIALALALWALRRAGDHERLRQRVAALEAQMAALRSAGGALPVTTAAFAEVPAVSP